VLTAVQFTFGRWSRITAPRACATTPRGSMECMVRVHGNPVASEARAAVQARGEKSEE
jgi:hypothetical protein